MDPTILLLAALVAVSAGALAYAFLFQQIEVEKKTTSRFKRVQAAETDHTNIKAARDRDCDLIVMASHGRRGVEGFFVGSETIRVLTHSKIPVLVHR